MGCILSLPKTLKVLSLHSLSSKKRFKKLTKGKADVCNISSSSSVTHYENWPNNFDVSSDFEVSKSGSFCFSVSESENDSENDSDNSIDYTNSSMSSSTSKTYSLEKNSTIFPNQNLKGEVNRLTKPPAPQKPPRAFYYTDIRVFFLFKNL